MLSNQLAPWAQFASLYACVHMLAVDDMSHASGNATECAVMDRSAPSWTGVRHHDL